MNKQSVLPKEVTQKVFVVVRQSRNDKAPRVVIADYDLSKLTYDADDICVTLASHEITLPVPQDIDIIGKQVVRLREKRKQILAEAQVQANAIEERINSLLALDYKPEAAE